MPGLHRSFIVAAALAAAAVLPATASATPNGQGLFPHTADSCFDSSGALMDSTTMLLSSGGTFWMGGVHYAIQSYTVTFADGSTASHDYGVKAGLIGTGPIECYGHFDELGGYDVHSTDVAIG